MVMSYSQQYSKSSAPVWPSWDLIAASMNARSSIYGRMSDDPLLGIPITQDMINRAQEYERSKREAIQPA